jgi:hypothetical protein
MRLPTVEKGTTLKPKLMRAMARVVFRRRLPDVVRTVLHRHEWFGDHLNRLSQSVMRGPSEWSVGERELFAAFVSRVNQCPF